jgi:hypothetical protein
MGGDEHLGKTQNSIEEQQKVIFSGKEEKHKRS